ncbi:hypothetical protein ALC56_14993 [Trachymyrmex septentrionalis]|uniref:DDE-1 domain-containing protein n=1 Tax=Trachymyrmex septentrionalis TaxID=34720 RepID=A0A151JSW9_9HYME|nr:hypothetical protein ALC56_14993 [Trachymyrmex septentrionalis]
MSYLKAAKEFNVPKGKNLARLPIFTSSQEKQLIQYALAMESKFHGLTKRDLQCMTCQFARANNIIKANCTGTSFARVTESPILLILDDNNSHTRNIDVIDLALKHHVIILTILLHSNYSSHLIKHSCF